MARGNKDSDQVKIYDLKAGDRFYGYYDGLVYIFISCEYDPLIPDKISIRMKPVLVGRVAMDVSCIYSGLDIAERILVYRYTGRNRGSFMAGFTRAMALCTKHMGKFDLENAELDNPVLQHMTMLKEYKLWKKNNEIL